MCGELKIIEKICAKKINMKMKTTISNWTTIYLI
jgi:hypothetical protein